MRLGVVHVATDIPQPEITMQVACKIVSFEKVKGRLEFVKTYISMKRNALSRSTVRTTGVNPINVGKFGVFVRHNNDAAAAGQSHSFKRVHCNAVTANRIE